MSVSGLGFTAEHLDREAVMKLKYRGVTYDRKPNPIRLSSTCLRGKYRGVPILYPAFVTDIPQPEAELTYRGVTYRTDQGARAKDITPVPTGVSAAVAAQASAARTSLEERLREMMLNHHRQVVNRERSMLMRTGEDVGLPVEDMLHFRRHIQGYTPADEWQAYERSHAAIS
jgi:Domain of unknown function (DUF4278)